MMNGLRSIKQTHKILKLNITDENKRRTMKKKIQEILEGNGIDSDIAEQSAERVLRLLDVVDVIKSVCEKCRFKDECRFKEMNTEQNCKYFIDEQIVL